ncbi:MAG: BtpA/SgcQ family protein [archaeon]
MIKKLFGVEKAVIGMIHLSGTSDLKIIDRALEELDIYQRNGINGAIIEDYCCHGRSDLVEKVLYASEKGFDKIVRGVNFLANPYLAFALADKHGAKFIQFDSVHKKDLYMKMYNELRETYKDIAVFGGVRFKYVQPTGQSLEKDIEDALPLCDSIVTTGPGTGKETPISKLRDFKRTIDGRINLISGAGVTANNMFEQFSVVDGVIIGSYFKPEGDCEQKVSEERVIEIARVWNSFVKR